MGFGLSGVIPAMHYLYSEGWFKAVSEASLGSLLLMGFLYIMGALCYASRVPERFFPGKCDIWVSPFVCFFFLDSGQVRINARAAARSRRNNQNNGVRRIIIWRKAKNVIEGGTYGAR